MAARISLAIGEARRLDYLSRTPVTTLEGERRVRSILIGCVMMAVVFPAWAQTRSENIARCEGDDPDAAIESCTALLQSGQETAANISAFYNNRGAAYCQKGLYDQALADENKAIALNPNLAAAYINRGSVYAHQGRYDLAVADESRAIALNDAKYLALAYGNRGNHYSDTGHYVQAIEDLNRAIALEPNHATFYNNRAWAYHMKGADA